MLIFWIIALSALLSAPATAFLQSDDIVLTAYDAADQIMGSATLPTVPTFDFRFVGLVAEEPIARVELQSTGTGGDPDRDDFSVEIAASGPLPAPWQRGLRGAGLVLLARRFG